MGFLSSPEKPANLRCVAWCQRGHTYAHLVAPSYTQYMIPQDVVTFSIRCNRHGLRCLAGLTVSDEILCKGERKGRGGLRLRPPLTFEAHMQNADMSLFILATHRPQPVTFLCALYTRSSDTTHGCLINPRVSPSLFLTRAAHFPRMHKLVCSCRPKQKEK